MASERAPVSQEQTSKIASELEATQWNRRKKMWNRFIGYGLLSVAAGLGLLALSVATMGTVPTALLVGANVLSEGGSAFVTGGILARLFDRNPKKK